MRMKCQFRASSRPVRPAYVAAGPCTRLHAPHPDRTSPCSTSLSHRGRLCSNSLPDKQAEAPDAEQVTVSRRGLTLGLAAAVSGAALLTTAPASRADDFTKTSSGLRYLDLRPGEGATPQPGDTVVVHWAGYTKGYQGKRIDNTSVRDEPYEFVLGSSEAIPAFEEAVSTMKVGGVRRVEVPGEIPSLSYPRDRSQRFTNELVPSKEGKIYKYRYGPQPVELSGQRSLDFVLDNATLNDLNRTLLFDIKLLAVRKPRGGASKPTV